MIFYLKKVLACLNRSLYDEDKEMSNLSMIKQVSADRGKIKLNLLNTKLLQ